MYLQAVAGAARVLSQVQAADQYETSHEGRNRSVAESVDYFATRNMLWIIVCQ